MLTKSADLLDKLLERVNPAAASRDAARTSLETDFRPESWGSPDGEPVRPHRAAAAESVASSHFSPHSYRRPHIAELDADFASWDMEPLGATRLALIEAIGNSGLPVGIAQADGSLLLAVRDRLGLVMFSRYDASLTKEQWTSPAGLLLSDLCALLERGIRGGELRELIQEQGASRAHRFKAQIQLHLRVGHALRELDVIEKQHREAVRAGRLIGRLLFDPHSVTPDTPRGIWVLVLELDGLRARVSTVLCISDVATGAPQDSGDRWIDLRHWIG